MIAVTTGVTDGVLVTGALGLVGVATVRHLARQGRRVVATDVDTAANRRTAATLPRAAEVRWADLTDPDQVSGLVAATAPASIIHLAAIIPPLCYAAPVLARRVNVDATAHLVNAAGALTSRPRLVLASSIAVYGPRNPHHARGVLTAGTPTHPCDTYGRHKVEAEQIVRSSGLEWVILRLGGVLSADMGLSVSRDVLYFASLLPADGRLQTVDVRDVAHAFAEASDDDLAVAGRTLLIGGDDTHRQVQGDVAAATAAAMGLVGAVPPGRVGDPDDDGAWFATDWMDTATAQEVLGHQHHSWPMLLAEMARNTGWKRYPLRLLAPVARQFLTRRSAYYREPGRYADPWGAVRRKWGSAERDGTRPDGSAAERTDGSST